MASIAHAPTYRRAGGMAAIAAMLAVGTACSTSHGTKSTVSSSSIPASATPPASSSRLPRITNPILPPTNGNIHQTVAPGTATTLRPVAMSATAAFGTGVSAQVVSSRKISTRASLPGEISGAAAEVKIELSNGSSRPIYLGNVVLNGRDAAGTPLVEMHSDPSAPVSGSVAPGKQATGTYVFALPANYRNPLTVSISYSVVAPIAIFVGTVQ
jgi:hypothetical protein